MKHFRGLIITVAVAITLISLYQLYFTFNARSVKANQIEAPARAFAEKAKLKNPSLSTASVDSIYRVKKASLTSQILNEEVSIFGDTYGEVRKKQLDLGLDLQGGAHITLVVSPEEIMKGIAGSTNSLDPKFLDALKAAHKAKRSSGSKFTTLFLKEYKALGGGALNSLFIDHDNVLGLSNDASDGDILDKIDERLKEAMKQSVVVLRSRIDAFGATSPVINAVESTGRIEVELPGATDIEKIERQLTTVAKLEFEEVMPANESSRYANNLSVALMKALTTKLETDKVEEVEKPITQITPDSTSGDDNLYGDDEDKIDSNQVVAKDTVINKTAQEELMKLFVNGGNGLYLTTLDKAQELSIYLASPEIRKAVIPASLDILIASKEHDRAKGYKEVFFIKKQKRGKPLLNGDVITRAYITRGETGALAAGMEMNPEGTRKWGEITEKLIGKQIAVVLDKKVYSAPSVNVAITTGSSVITGGQKGFAYEEVDELTKILSAGSLKAPMEIERVVTVGPSLGKAAVDRGLKSLAIGLLLVAVFMIAYYNKGGIVANVALLFNLFFILGILSTPVIGATLTFAGIAGIVLTIGMSIDANVLIFERIKEELKQGVGVKNAISAGYDKAIWTILDANVTTLISAVILYWLGSGLIKGFAITLMIGIFCSFFAAVFITRLILEFWLSKKEDTEWSFSTSLSKKLFQNVSFDFLGKRKIAYMVSGLVIAIGMTLVMTNGLNYGVAFKGGTRYTVGFDKAISVEDARTSFKEVFGEAGLEVKTIDSDRQLSVTTAYLVNSDEKGASAKVDAALEKALKKYEASNPQVLGKNVVSPTIADDIVKDAQLAVVLSLLAIFLYIVIRFGKKEFGFGALVALFHDVLVVISVFAIARFLGFSFEIEEAFVAAILTIVGYSINDTVVVFDRIRDYVGQKNPKNKAEYQSTISNALNDTLSRTLMTSITTLIVVGVLLIFGGEVLRGFSFALFIGVLVGTYSSVFIATPVVLDTTSEKSFAPKTDK